MLNSLAGQIAAELDALRVRHRLRSCLCARGASRVTVTLDGQQLTSFCSNDYLGMACNPALERAASEACERSGFGAGASRLVSGTAPEHLALEARLASLVRAEAALLFPSGYQANLGIITALAGPGDLIVADRAVHASLIDACRLSRAKLAFFRHADLRNAETHFRRLGPRARRRFLVTESLFSMDGDIAALPDLASLASASDATLIVDEAHAIGSLGPQGAGLCAHFGVEPDVLVGTLGKAVGASGAFVAGSSNLRSYLVNVARSFLFTTAVPPPVAAAALAAVDIITSPSGDLLRSRLRENLAILHASLGLPRYPLASPIVPLLLGTDEAALRASLHLRESGFLVPAIRPPAVREGTARLRITLSALHTPAQISALAAALAELPIDRPTSRPARPPVSSPSPAITSPSPALLRPPDKAGLILLGTDTGVGKSTVAVALLHLLVSRGHRPIPFKPVETGTASGPSDATRLLAACGRPDLPLDVVCPLSFPHPVAPAAAAASAGTVITLTLLLKAAASAQAHGHPLLVESAGGLLTPYGEQLTSCDLAQALGFPVLLIARNALGTINHTALALAELRRRALPLLGTVLVTTQPGSTPDQRTNLRLIAELTGHTPLGVLPYVQPPTPSLLASKLESSVDLSPVLAVLEERGSPSLRSPPSPAIP